MTAADQRTFSCMMTNRFANNSARARAQRATA
jgi:hypothetical protein